MKRKQFRGTFSQQKLDSKTTENEDNVNVEHTKWAQRPKEYNEISLSDWYLNITWHCNIEAQNILCINSPVWITLGGKRVGYEDYIHTSPIIDFIPPDKVTVSSGRIYIIVGYSDANRILENGFSSETTSAFKKAFPVFWKSVIIDEFENLLEEHNHMDGVSY